MFMQLLAAGHVLYCHFSMILGVAIYTPREGAQRDSWGCFTLHLAAHHKQEWFACGSMPP
jgi:hypothetical protein